MATFAIDPSEDPYADHDADLSPRAARPAKPGVSWGTIAIGLGAAASMAGLAELWTGAASEWWASAKSSRQEIRMGRVDDMPEIKNGVVAIGATGAPVRVIPGPATLTSAPAARPSENKAATIAPMPGAAPLAPATAAPQANAQRPAATARAAAEKGPVATGSTNAASPLPASAANQPVRPTIAAASVAATTGMTAGVSAPLPPAAPRTAMMQAAATPAPTPSPSSATAPSVSPPAPLPPIRAAARRPETAMAAPQRVATARPADAGPVEPGAEERSVLGIPVPGFVPTGRDIKSGFDSIGDAVMSLPKRF